jgi:hypothetical protein
MAVYIHSHNHGVTRYMASVGSGRGRKRKSFFSESAARAWETAELARHRSARTLEPDVAPGPIATTAELVGTLVERFVRCDRASQELIVRISEKLAQQSVVSHQISRAVDGDQVLDDISAAGVPASIAAR